MTLTPRRTRRRLLTALVAVLVTGGVVGTTVTASARTQLPVFGWDTVLVDGFNSGWRFDTSQSGTGGIAGPPGNPMAWLGVATTGWAAARKTIRVPAGPGGHPYERCELYATVTKTWGSKALVNLEAINPSTWNYMRQGRYALTTDKTYTIGTTSFTLNPREFVIGVAIEADPASQPVPSLNATFMADDVTLRCFYFYYP